MPRKEIVQSQLKGESGCNSAETLFCYLIAATGNKRLAATKAWGCKDHTSDNRAQEALKRPHVKNLLNEIRKRHIGTDSEIAEEIKKITDEIKILAFSSPVDYADILGLPDSVKKKLIDIGPAARAISDIEIEEYVVGEGVTKRNIKLKFHSKTKSLEMISKIHKLYADTAIIEGDIDSPVSHWGLPSNGMEKTVK